MEKIKIIIYSQSKRYVGHMYPDRTFIQLKDLVGDLICTDPDKFEMEVSNSEKSPLNIIMLEDLDKDIIHLNVIMHVSLEDFTDIIKVEE